MQNGTYRKKDSARIVWDSKPRRAPNPKDIEFQTAEVVIPNPETAGQLPMSFRDALFGEENLDKQKMNRLVWGDNLLAMQAMLNHDYEGKINLIYIDPPFDSKADYSHKIKLSSSVIPAKAGIQDFEITKEPSVIERLAYKDTWAGGTDSYLDMLYPRLQLMKRLLAPDGSIYVHLDWHVGHYVKVMMDEVFGKENFVNEIVWEMKGIGRKGGITKFPIDHQVIFLYSKSTNHYFQQQFYEDKFFKCWDKNGKEKLPNGWKRDENNKIFWTSPKGDYTDESIAQLEGEGRVYRTKTGGIRIKYFIEETEKEYSNKRYCTSVWTDISDIYRSPDPDTDYDTQKPEALIERIINASCPDKGLVADFFSGSGTTLAVAEKLNRRWIGCELGKVGIQVTRGRLVEMKSKPFLIENIGNYQREMIYLGGARIYEMQKIILKLYGAEPMANRKDLGVRKIFSSVMPDLIGHPEEKLDSRFRGNDKPGLELVYCGYPDRAVAAHKVADLATEAQTLDGAGYQQLVILAWDYEYNYDELLQARVKAAGKDLKTEIVSRQIPQDIYDYLKQIKSEEDLPAAQAGIERLSDKVKFLEKPYLKLKKALLRQGSGGQVEVVIGIEKYVLYDFPLGSGKKADEDREELLRLVKDNFAILIDYWAVDWDYDGLTFKSMWQDLRGLGRKTKVVTTEKEHLYENGGKHTIAVRVVDIFGNDATATMEIKV